MSLHRKNDVTGADLVTKASTDKYREGYDRIFGSKKKVQVEGAQMPQEAQGLHTESVMDHLAHRNAEMSDREWAAQSAGLREGCTVHVKGVGDI